MIEPCLICGATVTGYLVIGMGETKDGRPVCSRHATRAEQERRMTRLLSQGGRDTPLRSNP